MKATESFFAYGHRNIKGTHRTTLEITKSDQVTTRGDCIIAVKASKSLREFSPQLKELLRKPSSRVLLVLEIRGLKEEVTGSGDPRLSLASDGEMVCRKSNYASGRTLMVRADKAAIEIDRMVIRALTNPANEVQITLTAEG